MKILIFTILARKLLLILSQKLNVFGAKIVTFRIFELSVLKIIFQFFFYILGLEIVINAQIKYRLHWVFTTFFILFTVVGRF